MPLAFRNLDEVDFLTEKLRPQPQARLQAKGYVVLFWSDSGWVRFFSKSPVVHPDDLRKLKVFAWAGNAAEYDLWKASGFSQIERALQEIAFGFRHDAASLSAFGNFGGCGVQQGGRTAYAPRGNVIHRFPFLQAIYKKDG